MTCDTTTGDYWTRPRIFVEEDLKPASNIDLSQAHAHYFKNVLRQQDGDTIRLFNGRDGEWLAILTELGKKSGKARLEKEISPQPDNKNTTTLFFAPPKKARFDMVIEKAVELGATDLCPVITARTQNRKLKVERINTQIKEAAEQCERLSLPKLHTPIALKDLPTEKIIYACVERSDIREQNHHGTNFIANITGTNLAFLVGPEGGFTAEETDFLLQHNNITPVSLGSRIYRAETASILCLAHATLLMEK